MSIYYESNNDGRGKHSWGEPELIISYPENSLTLDELLDHVMLELNENINSEEISEFVQAEVSDDAVEIDIADRADDGRLRLHLQCGVHAGDGVMYTSGIDLFLDYCFSEEGIDLQAGDRKEADLNAPW
jgi:hypothetical protein